MPGRRYFLHRAINLTVNSSSLAQNWSFTFHSMEHVALERSLVVFIPVYWPGSLAFVMEKHYRAKLCCSESTNPFHRILGTITRIRVREELAACGSSEDGSGSRWLVETTKKQWIILYWLHLSSEAQKWNKKPSLSKPACFCFHSRWVNHYHLEMPSRR